VLERVLDYWTLSNVVAAAKTADAGEATR
jgi:hypothetical protein